jgi:hypothetical protein
LASRNVPHFWSWSDVAFRFSHCAWLSEIPTIHMSTAFVQYCLDVNTPHAASEGWTVDLVPAYAGGDFASAIWGPPCGPELLGRILLSVWRSTFDGRALVVEMEMYPDLARFHMPSAPLPARFMHINERHRRQRNGYCVLFLVPSQPTGSRASDFTWLTLLKGTQRLWLATSAAVAENLHQY